MSSEQRAESSHGTLRELRTSDVSYHRAMIVMRDSTGAPITMGEAQFAAAVRAGHVNAEVPASNDGGMTWRPARQLAGTPPPMDTQIAAAFVPIGVAGWAMVGGYWAILVLIFGGIAELGMIAAAGHADAKGVVCVASGIVVLLGAGPCALFGWLGQRAIRKDPTRRGMGRVGFAYVVAGLIVVGGLAALVRAAIS